MGAHSKLTREQMLRVQDVWAAYEDYDINNETLVRLTCERASILFGLTVDEADLSRALKEPRETVRMCQCRPCPDCQGTGNDEMGRVGNCEFCSGWGVFDTCEACERLASSHERAADQGAS